MKTCPKCKRTLPADAFNVHAGRSDGLQSCCRACMKGYRNVHADADRQRCREWYQAHKAHAHAASKRWVREHPDARKAIQRRYWERNVETIRQKSMAHWRKDYAEHPEKYKARAKDRRARVRGLPTRVTAAEWRTIQDTFNGHCAYCLRPIPDEKGKRTQDHMKPLCQAGPHQADNIVLACHSCNSRKRHLSLMEYAAQTLGHQHLRLGCPEPPFPSPVASRTGPLRWSEQD